MREICKKNGPEQGARRMTRITDKDGPIRIHDAILEGYAADLRAIIRNSDVPVVLVTLMRNFDYAPGGTLVQEEEGCALLFSCLTPDPTLDELSTLLNYSEQTCGETSSVTWWLRARELDARGEAEASYAAWEQTLALDPMPLRAPLSLDDTIRSIADEEGAILVDLSNELGPLQRNALFIDTLHPSEEGGHQLADILAPVIRANLP